ncbi:AcrR family transcriptional regulator [Nakamurella sp. UYEF19]|uniref:TetR/AcrR family transcriptional regulator n=1 Tax=Nakamurella sp. UYEF19 TaxID=1756392 RepID=UPI003391766F
MAVTEDTDGMRARRSDAQRNRARLLVAAREVFAESGLAVPMSEIARRAGVGIATLSRNFATREAIIDATFAPRMTAYADAMQAALGDPDPWNGFSQYVWTVCGMQAADRGFAHVLTMTFPSALELEAERTRAYKGLRTLIARAKAAGALRPDFSSVDLALILMANAGVVGATGDAAPTAWRRMVAYFVRACAVDAVDPLPPAPRARQMQQALHRIHDPL